MTYFDESLLRLQEQTVRFKHLESVIRDLQTRRSALRAQLAECERQKANEEQDVERLERPGLTSFFYSALGKLDEKMEKERAEAYAAAMRYDTAIHALASLEEDLKQLESERAALTGCEARYQAALAQKSAALLTAGGRNAGEILRIQSQSAYIDSQSAELREAIEQGGVVLKSAQQVLDALNSARSWSTWDVMGGGLIADLSKHDDLERAQHAVENLQIHLSAFQAELSDVSISADIQVSVGGFSLFADLFWDGFFFDLSVRNQIDQSIQQTNHVIRQVERVLDDLHSTQKALTQQQQSLHAQLETLLCQARL